MINTKAFIQLIKFGLVGCVCLLIDMAITIFLKEYVGIDKYVANSVGFAISSSINFFLHKFWTFGSSGKKALKEYYTFIMIACAGLLLNSFTVFIFTDLIELNLSRFIPVEDFYISKMIAVVLVFFWNFGMNRRFTFKPQVTA